VAGPRSDALGACAVVGEHLEKVDRSIEDYGAGSAPRAVDRGSARHRHAAVGEPAPRCARAIWRSRQEGTETPAPRRALPAPGNYEAWAPSGAGARESPAQERQRDPQGRLGRSRSTSYGRTAGFSTRRAVAG